MKTSYQSLLGAVAALGMMSVPAGAAQFAYEGFGSAAAGSLEGVSASGSGFTGAWTVTNGDSSASVVEAGGLSYPAGYQGSHVAVGGNGRVTGTSANSALALGFTTTADFRINNATSLHIGFLAQRVGTTVTAAGVLDSDARTAGNLASEYPRNFGFRINTVSASSNNALGTIGKGSDWNSNGVTFGDPNPLIIDTWGAGGFNDTNNLYTGADFADGVDHLVLTINPGNSSYRLQVNPQPDGTNDGQIRWNHTDEGAQVPFVMKAFGVTAGSNSGDRPVGDMVFDEIYIADTFEEAAGFVQVPEPSVTLLGGLGVLGLLRRRRS